MSNFKILILCNMLFFGLPFLAFAASHTYTCGDMVNVVGSPQPTCSSGVWTFTSAKSQAASDWSSPAFNLSSAATWYVNYTYSGSGSLQTYTNGSVYSGTPATISGGTQVTIALPTPHDTNTGIQLDDGGSNSFNGTIGPVCVDDDNSSCGESHPAPIPNRFNNLFGNATTTASSSQILAIVDIPNVDLFMGYMVFLSSASFLVWIFKSSRI